MSALSLEQLLQQYASLSHEVKCACGDYLRPPIRLCASGHGCCARCRRAVKRCPTCQEEFTETRSVALEAVVDKLRFPCPHLGCAETSTLQDLDAHTEDCSMRPTGCFMAKVYADGCDWVGLAADWLVHCESAHAARVTAHSCAAFSGPALPQRGPVVRYHLLKCYRRVFNVYQIYDSKSGKMMWSVVMTGDTEEEEPHQFYFDLELYNPDDPTRKISFRQSCKNGNDLDILDSNQNVLLPLEQVLYMLDGEKNLHFRLLVSEMKSLRDDANKDSPDLPM